MPISLVLGDMTRVEADAIVNAANPTLAPGGGVCGAIHSAGGPAIAAECRLRVAGSGPVATGDAAATTAGRLDARYVIHAVGPIWHGGRSGEAEALASAYTRSVEVADELGLTSIAFPSISTGIYGYPVDLAAPVAIAAVRDALGRTRHVRDVVFVLFDPTTFAAFEQALSGGD